MLRVCVEIKLIDFWFTLHLLGITMMVLHSNGEGDINAIKTVAALWYNPAQRNVA